MRNPIVLLAMLAGCSGEPRATDAELEDFVPPTVRARGDVVPQAQRRFARLDKNRDGVLVAAEFRRDGARRVAALDGNKDGRVSRSEYVEAALRRFDRGDGDRDGQVTPQERDAIRNGAG